MIRNLSLATVIALGLAFPSLAETATVKDSTEATAAPAARGNLFTEKQARAHLTQMGYTNVSPLTKDENGVWRGSATKDGKSLIVAVDVKGLVGQN